MLTVDQLVNAREMHIQSIPMCTSPTVRNFPVEENEKALR